ncbi:unnamed protein product, partial [Effrenium voratum]
ACEPVHGRRRHAAGSAAFGLLAPGRAGSADCRGRAHGALWAAWWMDFSR